MILLDTNVLSALMRREPDLSVVSWLDRLPAESIWTTMITVFEVVTALGLLPEGRRRRELEHAFDRLLAEELDGRIQSFDNRAAQAAGRIAAERQRVGRAMKIRDVQIAGIARARRAQVATRNTLVSSIAGSRCLIRGPIERMGNTSSKGDEGQMRTAGRFRTISAVTATVCIGVVLAIFAVPAADARPTSPPAVAAKATSGEPVLGEPAAGTPGIEGVGQVRPRTFGFEGDETSGVAKIRWASWGGERAVGHGTADWVWPGWCTACGSVELPATVVAYGRTQCQGQTAYTEIEWYFPSRGQTFSTRLGQSICPNGASSGGSEPRTRSCRDVFTGTASDPGLASFIKIYDGSVSCSAVRKFIASSPAARYINRNARFHKDGWWCGSEISMDLGGPQTFSCSRGDFDDIGFNLEPDGE